MFLVNFLAFDLTVFARLVITFSFSKRHVIKLANVNCVGDECRPDYFSIYWCCG